MLNTVETWKGTNIKIFGTSDGFKKCGISHTFQNPPTLLTKCGKKIKITWSKNHFYKNTLYTVFGLLFWSYLSFDTRKSFQVGGKVILMSVCVRF